MEGAVVEGLATDLAEVCQFARLVILGPNQMKEVVRIFGGEGGGEHALIRTHEIRSGY